MLSSLAAGSRPEVASPTSWTWLTMPSSELSILLVEDNPAEVQRLSAFLSLAVRCHLKTTHVASLSAAKETLSRSMVDVILLDWRLPDRQGVDSLRELQAVAPRTPLVMLVGWDDDEAAMAALHAGAQDVLVKDQLTTSVLERTIRYAVERKQAESVL